MKTPLQPVSAQPPKRISRYKIRLKGRFSPAVVDKARADSGSHSRKAAGTFSPAP